MDAATFRDDVETATATELDRLGSQQSLVALTDADLDAEAVLRAVARSEHAARETFAEWAETEADAEASETFAALARQEDDHYDRVAAELDDASPGAPHGGAEKSSGETPRGPGEADAMHDYLRGLDDTVERAAGLVGRSLVGDRTQLQVINFFVNDADEGRADLFRDLRADTREGIEGGAELLVSRCDGEDDWTRAREAAEGTIRVAYDDYAETLQGMGLDPKPIC